MNHEVKLFELLSKIIELEKTSINNIKVTEKQKLNAIESVIERFTEDENNSN